MKTNCLKETLCLFFFFLALTSSIAQTVFFSNGIQEYQKGNFNDAISWFSKSISSDSSNSKSYMMRGASKGYIKDFTGALEDLNTSLKLNPNEPKVYYQMGRVFFFQGKYSEAIQYYDKAIVKNSSIAYFYDDRAIAKAALKKLREAIEDETTAIKLDSSDIAFYSNRGFFKGQLGDFNLAIKDYKKCLTKDPHDATVLVNMGHSCFGLTNYDEAIKYYSKAIIENPKAVDAYFYRGNAFVKLNQHDEACKDYSKAADLGYEPAIMVVKNICVIK